MKVADIFSLLGGLALFLYGMQMMSSGLEAAAGNRMKQILEKLTSNRFWAYWSAPSLRRSFSLPQPLPLWWWDLSIPV